MTQEFRKCDSITDLQVTEVEVDDDVVEEALVLEAHVVLGVDGHLVQTGRRELAVLGVDLSECREISINKLCTGHLIKQYHITIEALSS